MPLALPRRTMHMFRHPQDLFRGFHRGDREEQENHLEGQCRIQTLCLPRPRGGKQNGLSDAVKRLTGDVEELGNSQTAAAANTTAESKYAQLHALSEDVHKHLHTILGLIKELTGDARSCQRHVPPSDAIELLEQMIQADLPVQLLAQLPNLEFETRKDVMNVCCAMFWAGMPHHFDQQVVEYLRDHPIVFQLLVDGYTNGEVALHYGVVLRSCARHKELVQIFLHSGLVGALMKHATYPRYDISSDAFYSLREMLLVHRDVAAAWLEDGRNFRQFFDDYNAMLRSGTYVELRAAQNLLTEILMDRHFRKVMLAYVSDERNLQIHMNLLRDRSKVIQVEAFNVFKIFVVNPQKTSRIRQILFKNRDKLIQHLDTMQPVKPDDKRFADEQRNVKDRLRQLAGPCSGSPVRKVPSEHSQSSTSTSCGASGGASAEVDQSGQAGLGQQQQQSGNTLV